MAETKVGGAIVPTDATPESRPDLFGTRGQLRPDGEGGITSYMIADKPEYAAPEASGVASGFYVGDRGLPWHVTLARALNSPELMADAGGLLTARQALRTMGADFTVEKVPVVVEGTGVVVPRAFATVRSDTGEPLGVVGPGYRVLQPAEWAAFGEALVDSGEASYETGGLMRRGTWTFLSMELRHLDIVVPGDDSPLQTYLFTRNSYDGSTYADWFITQVRAVCRNTCNLAAGGALTRYRIRHSGGLEGKVAEARRALGIAFRDVGIIRRLAERLALTEVVDEQVRDILRRAVWPVRAEEGDEAAERVARHAERAYANYLESPTVDGVRGTAWGAYAGLTEYVDHLAIYRAGKRSGRDALDVRAESLIEGSGYEAKARGLRALTVLTR